MSDKSMAEVADKAVGKLADIADALGRLAPGVWESAVRSERVEGIINTTVIVAMVALALFSVRVYRRAKADDAARKDKSDPPFRTILFGCISGFAVVFAVGISCDELATQVSRVISPEYYAAQRLIETVNGAGQ